MKKILLLLVLNLLAFNAYAQDTLIQWIPPTEREDNTLLGDDLAGFNIYYGGASGIYSSNVNIPNPLATNYVLNLGYGTHYAVVTAYDSDGRESIYSTEVSINIPPPPPKPVTGVTWVVSE